MQVIGTSETSDVLNSLQSTGMVPSLLPPFPQEEPCDSCPLILSQISEPSTRVAETRLLPQEMAALGRCSRAAEDLSLAPSRATAANVTVWGPVHTHTCAHAHVHTQSLLEAAAG